MYLSMCAWGWLVVFDESLVGWLSLAGLSLILQSTGGTWSCSNRNREQLQVKLSGVSEIPSSGFLLERSEMILLQMFSTHIRKHNYL